MFDNVLNIVPLWISKSFRTWAYDQILVARSPPHHFITTIHDLEWWIIFIKPFNRCSFIAFSHSSFTSPVIWCLIALVESTGTSFRSYNKLRGSERKVNISIRSGTVLLSNTLCTNGHWELPIYVSSVPFSLKTSSIERSNQINFRTFTKLHGSFGTLS